jgi:hypothetical protein
VPATSGTGIKNARSRPSSAVQTTSPPPSGRVSPRRSSPAQHRHCPCLAGRPAGCAARGGDGLVQPGSARSRVRLKHQSPAFRRRIRQREGASAGASAATHALRSRTNSRATPAVGASLPVPPGNRGNPRHTNQQPVSIRYCKAVRRARGAEPVPRPPAATPPVANCSASQPLTTVLWYTAKPAGPAVVARSAPYHNAYSARQAVLKLDVVHAHGASVFFSKWLVSAAASASAGVQPAVHEAEPVITLDQRRARADALIRRSYSAHTL